MKPLKTSSANDEEMLNALFAFDNEHLEHVIQTVQGINQMRQELKQELNERVRPV